MNSINDKLYIYEKDGEKRSFTKVKVDRIEFQKGGGNSNTEKKVEDPTFQEFDAIDEDIPF